MKKNVLKLMALTFAVSLTLSFAGCGDKDTDSDKDNSSKTKTEESKTEESKESETEEASEESTEESESSEQEAPEYTSLEEMLNSPEGQEIADSLSTDDYTVELYAENGNILVYHYTFNEQLDLSDESVKQTFTEYMDTYFDSFSDVFASMLDLLRDEMNMDDLMFRVVIVNADGSEIMTRDFE